jgi:hypothetical protein
MKKKLMYILAVILVFIVCLYFLMDKKIHVQKELVINKNVEEVWEVIGNQFAHVHLWSTNFKESKPGGSSKFPDLDYSERVTLTGRGETIQALDSFDAASHSLAYHITKGAPSIAKHASAVWSLKSDEVNKTTVILEFNMETKGFMGFLMSPLIKIGIGKSAIEIAEDLKFYVENGSPHPRKVKSK